MRMRPWAAATAGWDSGRIAFLADATPAATLAGSGVLTRKTGNAGSRSLVEGREPTGIDTSRPESRRRSSARRRPFWCCQLWIGGGRLNTCLVWTRSLKLGFTGSYDPQAWQAWQVSRLKCVPCNRSAFLEARGFSLHEFSLTARSSHTRSRRMVVALQNQQRRNGADRFANGRNDQAAEELAKTEKVDAQLTQAGHYMPDAAELLKKAHAALDKKAPNCGGTGSHEEAYEQAQAALRSLRILMRAHWDVAVKQFKRADGQPVRGQLLHLAQTLAVHG